MTRCTLVSVWMKSHTSGAKSNGVCLATVTNTLKKYIEGGIDAVTEFNRNVNSDNARRVLDGRAEARIIELACGSVPKGHSRWTIRLLEKNQELFLILLSDVRQFEEPKKQTSTSQK
mgnify:CR=1 FL=1